MATPRALPRTTYTRGRRNQHLGRRKRAHNVRFVPVRPRLVRADGRRRADAPAQRRKEPVRALELLLTYCSPLSTLSRSARSRAPRRGRCSASYENTARGLLCTTCVRWGDTSGLASTRSVADEKNENRSVESNTALHQCDHLPLSVHSRTHLTARREANGAICTVFLLA